MADASSFPSIGDIGRALESWAPPGSAQSYDNVGLQVGDTARVVSRAVVALDLTPAVVSEAQAVGASLVVTHHPLLFRPLRALTADGFVSGLALRLAEAGIALYSAHTNLDAATGGVSFALADRLGLHDVRLLEPLADSLLKIVTSVPADFLESVRGALVSAGAGRMDVYAMDSGQEALVRLEVEVPRWDLRSVVAALRAVHPAEDVPCDVLTLGQPSERTGLGTVGSLAEPMSLGRFLERVADRLGAEALRYVGAPEAPVSTVAVCGGSGSSLIRRALSAGADAYVTGDITYHTFFDVLDGDGRPRMALIDAGHYETEAFTEALLCSFLAERFPAVDWRRTATRTSPIETFVPR